MFSSIQNNITKLIGRMITNPLLQSKELEKLKDFIFNKRTGYIIHCPS